jgi:hypothetical protein
MDAARLASLAVVEVDERAFQVQLPDLEAQRLAQAPG